MFRMCVMNKYDQKKLTSKKCLISVIFVYQKTLCNKHFPEKFVYWIEIGFLSDYCTITKKEVLFIKWINTCLFWVQWSRSQLIKNKSQVRYIFQNVHQHMMKSNKDNSIYNINVWSWVKNLRALVFLTQFGYK